MVDKARINNTLGKMAYHLDSHNSICVSVSGGSDSDIIVHIIATYFREYLKKVHFVFVDTGLEYKATKDHLCYLEKRYNIKINRIKGTPIPLAVKQNGVPFLSKQISEFLQRMQKHGLSFSKHSIKNAPKGTRAVIRWWCNDFGEGSRYNVEYRKFLKEFLIHKKPTIRFSNRCCMVSKKSPLTKFEKSVCADLVITGERKSEGGARAGAHSDCFEKRKDMDRYMPLWFWDNETKQWYKNHEGIRYSDCYEVWGMRRTGCVGCPYGRNIKDELKLMKKYEPKLYTACVNIFGDSYKLTAQYNKFKENKRSKNKK